MLVFAQPPKYSVMHTFLYDENWTPRQIWRRMAHSKTHLQSPMFSLFMIKVMMTMLTIIILVTHFVKRYGYILAVLECCLKLPDLHLNLIGKQVSVKKVHLSVPLVWAPHELKHPLRGCWEFHKLSWVWSQQSRVRWELFIDNFWIVKVWHLHLWLYSASHGQCRWKRENILSNIWRGGRNSPERRCVWKYIWAFGETLFASAGWTTGGCKRRLFSNWWMQRWKQKVCFKNKVQVLFHRTRLMLLTQ